jgi:DNA-binding NarL/FixJ family response regulator
MSSNSQPTSNAYSCTYAHTGAVLHCQAADRLAINRFRLTRRELDVVRLLVLGLTDKAIGLALCIQPQTVRVHVSAILKKTLSTTRTMAAVRVMPYIG